MLKRLTLFSALALIQGCTSTYQLESGSPEMSSVSYEGKTIHASVNNTIESGFLSSQIRNELIVYVDGNKIIESPMHDDFSGNFTAVYNSDVFSLKCQKPAFYKTVECLVHVNNKVIGNLNFEYVI
ncbi:TPA: hypothetical protein NG589_001213 [Vibrio parahaemolyticus]|nr:hypothetical protein [Vibrio parahaemolyticus]